MYVIPKTQNPQANWPGYLNTFSTCVPLRMDTLYSHVTYNTENYPSNYYQTGHDVAQVLWQCYDMLCDTCTLDFCLWWVPPMNRPPGSAQ